MALATTAADKISFFCQQFIMNEIHMQLCISMIKFLMIKK